MRLNYIKICRNGTVEGWSSKRGIFFRQGSAVFKGLILPTIENVSCSFIYYINFTARTLWEKALISINLFIFDIQIAIYTYTFEHRLQAHNVLNVSCFLSHNDTNKNTIYLEMHHIPEAHEVRACDFFFCCLEFRIIN